MGLDNNGVRLLAYTKTLDPKLDSIAMIGRQSLHTDAGGLAGIFEEFGIPFNREDLSGIVREGEGYCEPLLRHMGFGCVESFDFSDYEKPYHVHDFNKPIPPGFDRRYDLVLDGGTLEHVFDFPTALRNSMRMVKPGGIFATITPCNNQCGHGFYQFSPELYFSLLRGNNGFKLVDLFCHELAKHADWHRVIDPATIKNRVNLLTWRPIMMLVIARRIESGDLPEFRIQQSDYETLWAGENLENPSQQSRNVKSGTLIRRLVARSIPHTWIARIRNLLEPERFPPGYFTNADSGKDSLLKSALAARHDG